MEFLTPILFGGLTLVSAPVIIHLLHRRKIKPVDWAAMRFLLDLLTKKRRRLLLNELLLLLVRVLIIACIALAMVRPALKRNLENPAATGSAIARHGRTGAVLMIDDSLSSQAGRAQSAFEGMKRLAVAYLGTLAAGDEISVVLMSQAGQPAEDPAYDIDAVKASILAAKPTFAASDIPALIESGLARLKRHANRGAELVLVTDGMADGWRFHEVARWEELRRRLRGPATAPSGVKERPQILLLCPPSAEVLRNIGVTAIIPDRSVLTFGSEAAFKVFLRSRGNPADTRARVQFLVDGRPAGQKIVTLPPEGEAEAVFNYTFTEAGSYSVEARLLDNHDFLPGDDQRALSVQVEPSLPVLLVDGDERPGLLSKLGFLGYALEPEARPGGPFKVTRVSPARFVPTMLPSFRVVVLGDVASLEPAMVDAIERYVVGGGGLLAGLGPNSDPAVINKSWARGGEGFFPATLASAATPAKGVRPAALNRLHPAFAGFGAKLDDAWKSAVVKSYFTLAPDARQKADLDIALKLDNGDPLIVEKRRGLGLVALVTTSLNADWNDLPIQPAYVPLVRGVVGQIGSFIMPPRNLLPGEPLIYAHVSDPANPITGEDPSGKPLPLSMGGWEGRDAILSAPLNEPGVYLLRDPRITKPVRFTVAPSPGESSLEPLGDKDLAQAFEPAPPVLRNPGQVTEKLASARRQNTELWKWLLAAAAGLMFLEAWMTRRETAMTLGGAPAS